MSLKKTIQALKENDNFLITAHTSLEGDALGSELAVYALLRAMGKRAVIVNDDVIPYGYEFLGAEKKIKRFVSGSIPPFDCLVIVDCSDLSRSGRVGSIDLAGKTVINIDHHISNQYFGDVNWVKPDSASCSQMIYELYKRMGIRITKESATYLYVGILTDTGCFHYSNTTAATHRVAAELVGYGLDVAGIYRNINENMPLSDAEVLLKILPAMRISCGGKVAWFEVRRSVFSGRKLSMDLSEQILHFGRSIKGVEIVVLFKENSKTGNDVRVNFRSRGKTDVNRIAGIFGGGGHRTASGCTVKGNIGAVAKKVLRVVSDNLK